MHWPRFFGPPGRYKTDGDAGARTTQCFLSYQHFV